LTTIPTSTSTSTIIMTEGIIAGDLPDVGKQASEVDTMTSTTVTSDYIFDETEDLPLAIDNGDRDMNSLPSLESFASLTDFIEDGDQRASKVLELVGEEMHDDDDDDEDIYDIGVIIHTDLVSGSPITTTTKLPPIVGLEISKDARPGKTLSCLYVSADSLVNKRRSECELGARWKDGSIPISKLIRQLDQKLQQQDLQDGQDNSQEQATEEKPRRRTSASKFRSLSPPPPSNVGHRLDGNLSDDGDDLILASSDPPPVQLISREVAPVGPSLTSPTKPERKISLVMANDCIQGIAPLTSSTKPERKISLVMANDCIQGIDQADAASD